MFMWKYFFLYTAAGALTGFTHPLSGTFSGGRPVDAAFPVIGTITMGLLIWNLISFGLFWARISLVEVVLGIFIGKSVAIRAYRA